MISNEGNFSTINVLNLVRNSYKSCYCPQALLLKRMLTAKYLMNYFHYFVFGIIIHFFSEYFICASACFHPINMSVNGLSKLLGRYSGIRSVSLAVVPLSFASIVNHQLKGCPSFSIIHCIPMFFPDQLVKKQESSFPSYESPAYKSNIFSFSIMSKQPMQKICKNRRPLACNSRRTVALISMFNWHRGSHSLLLPGTSPQ